MSVSIFSNIILRHQPGLTLLVLLLPSSGVFAVEGGEGYRGRIQDVQKLMRHRGVNCYGGGLDGGRGVTIAGDIAM